MARLRRSWEWKKTKWLEQDRICPLCGELISRKHMKHAGANIDHKRPRAHGGSDEDDNLQIVHRACNREKGDTCPGCEVCADGYDAYLLWRVKRKYDQRRS